MVTTNCTRHGDARLERPASEEDDVTTQTRWPTLPVAEWAETRDTLQLWTQIVG